MQAASDIFLGWFRGTEGRDFYWRQLKDMKGSAKVESMSADELVLYGGSAAGRWPGRTPAPATACRSPHTSARASASIVAIADFAEAYADQTERDHPLPPRGREVG